MGRMEQVSNQIKYVVEQPVKAAKEKRQKKEQEISLIQTLQEEVQNLKKLLELTHGEKEMFEQNLSAYENKQKSQFKKVYPLWTELFQMDPYLLQDVAKEFSVHPKNSEYRENIHSFDAVLEAFLKGVHYSMDDQKLLKRNLEKKENDRQCWEERYLLKEKECLRYQKELQELKEKSPASPVKVTFGKGKIRILNPKNWQEDELEPEINPFENEEIEETIETKTETEPEASPNTPPSLEDLLESYQILGEFPSGKEEAREIEETSEPYEEEEYYVKVLKDKGYTVKDAEKDVHDKIICFDDENVPVCYFNHPVDKGIFDQIMEDEKKIILIFSDKMTEKVVNGAFTMWKFANKNKDFEFSLNKLEDIQKKGLNRLSC